MNSSEPSPNSNDALEPATLPADSPAPASLAVGGVESPESPDLPLSVRTVLSHAVASRRTATRLLRIPLPVFPGLDRQVILAAAQRGGDGLARALDFHTATFFTVLGGMNEALRQTASDIAGNYNGIAAMEQRQNRRLHGTEPYIDHHSPGRPWTWGARWSVAFLLTFSFIMIGVGINTIAQVLVNSGLSGFESGARAYLFSFVATGVAVGLKFVPRFFELDSTRRNYGLCVWGIGIVLGIIWACLFSLTFPGMTQNPMEVISGALSSGASAQPTGAGWWLIFCGLMAEAFLAAGCWLSIEAISSRFTTRRRTPNQAHQQVLKDLTCLARAKHEVGEHLGAVRGRLEQIEQAHRALRAKVTEYFGLALAAKAHEQYAFGLFNDPPARNSNV
jgi:hypothetical protein